MDLIRLGGHPRVWRQSLWEGSPHAKEHRAALHRGVQGRGGSVGPLLFGGVHPPARLHELGIADQTLRNWIKQAQIDRGEREGLTTQEREELSRLRPENRIRTNAADFAFEDHTGLLKRFAADRAVVALRDAKDAETKLWDLVEVVNRWIVT